MSPRPPESRALAWSGARAEQAALGDLIFPVVYQVCSREIEVKAKFQEKVKESFTCNLLFFQGSQALGSDTDLCEFCMSM